MTELTEAERLLLDWARQLARIAESNAQHPATDCRRYRSQAELLLQRGRLFTPAPALNDLGPAKACYRNASEYADNHADVLYAEGIAAAALPPPLEHAWFATGTGATDPTWPDGQAYLGLPWVDDYRQQRQQETGNDSLLWSPSAIDILRDGLPDGAVADIGRPVPTTPTTISNITTQR